jgi:predicted Zn-dependent peptidase
MIRKYLTADETTKQRDALAEALEHMLTHGETHQPPLRDTISNIALQALAATKGGQHE